MTDGYHFSIGDSDERRVRHEETEQEIKNLEKEINEHVSYLHPLFTWSELWTILDYLTVQQIRLEEELAQKECPTKKAELTQVNTDLLIVNERLRVMANRT